MSNNDIHDVAVVGAGPVGLMTTRLLGLAGHDVQLVERWPEAYPLPRAVHFDHEVGRLFQAAGLGEQVRDLSERVPDMYEMRNRSGEVLAKIDWSADGTSGWPVANFFSQPELEAVLAQSVSDMPNVTFSRATEIVDLQEHDDHVQLTSADRTLKHRMLRARYVIGCDGANSFVRKHVRAPLNDLGFHFDWLIVDTIPQEQREWTPMNWQLCDPERPTTLVSGGPGRRRFEFMCMPGENRELLNTQETAWQLLKPWNLTPDNTVIERHAVYAFQARWADVWNQDRLLLAGDSAHLMPPFAGQGMCSGIRDAANLAWKLDLVLRGVAGADLLDTYTSERSVHLQHAIAMSVAIGRIVCELDPARAQDRDERMIAGGADPRTVLPPMPREQLGAGAWDQVLTPPDLQGALTPQLLITDGERTDLFDALIGTGFTLIGYGMDPTEGLSEERRRILNALSVRAVCIMEQGYEFNAVDSGSARPVVALGEVAHDLFVAHDLVAVLVRPDYYVYGAAATAADIGRLIDGLAAQVHLIDT